jgi:hypothetical protein
MFDRNTEYREVDSDSATTVPIAEEIHDEIRHIKVDEERSIKEITDKLIRESPTLQQRLCEGDNTGVEYLEDGTELRHQYSTGEYDGSVVKATIFDGKIVYGGDTFESPSPVAVQADKDIRGDDGLDNHNGWQFWKFENSDGEWVELDEIRG